MCSRFSKEYNWNQQVENTQSHIESHLETYNPHSAAFRELLYDALLHLAETVAQAVKDDWFADNMEQWQQAEKGLHETFLAALQAVDDGMLVHPTREEGDTTDV